MPQSTGGAGGGGAGGWPTVLDDVGPLVLEGGVTPPGVTLGTPGMIGVTGLPGMDVAPGGGV